MEFFLEQGGAWQIASKNFRDTVLLYLPYVKCNVSYTQVFSKNRLIDVLTGTVSYDINGLLFS